MKSRIPLIALEGIGLKRLPFKQYRGAQLVKKLGFSMYDIEQFLRDAGAERINEKAVISLGRELEDTVNTIVEEAALYANYAGRKKLIKASDINLVHKNGKAYKKTIMYKGKPIRGSSKDRARHMKPRMRAPQLMLINNVPVVREASEPSLQMQV